MPALHDARPDGLPDDSLLLRAVTVGARTVDVRLAGGRVERIGPPGTLPPAAGSLDLSGHLLLPAPAEPHAHFDTALTADLVPNPAGDLLGAIGAWERHQGRITRADYVRRATEAALLGLANGATAIRTHVGVYRTAGLVPVEALLEVQEALRGQVDLQLVALPRQMTGEGCADVRGMVRAALRMGVDVVGGCPHLDPDPAGCHELCLSLAAELGRPVDVHTDENLDPSVLHLPDLARRVAERGFPHGATASHCVSLGMQDQDVASEVAEKVAADGSRRRPGA